MVRFMPTSGTGRVGGWIDLSGLLGDGPRGGGRIGVLNGIAYDRKDDRIFVTGKLWPRLFEIRLIPVLMTQHQLD